MPPVSFDVVTKTILDEAGSEVVAWLTGRPPTRVDPVPGDLVETDVRLADRILRAEFPGKAGGPRYFHIELQLSGDRGMGLRMLLYWARIRRRLPRAEQRSAKVSSFVIYMDRRQYRPDPGVFRANDGFGTDCAFHYSVLKLWEMNPADVLELPGPGLAPLVPLMRNDDPVAAVIESKRRIMTADQRTAPLRRQADLCGALFVFAGLVIDDQDLLHRLIWEDWMGRGRWVTVQPLLEKGRKQGIEKGIEKGIEQGIKEGSVEARRDALLSFLRSRFGAVNVDLRRRILALDDDKLLRRLVVAAGKATNLAAFSALLGSSTQRRSRRTSR